MRKILLPAAVLLLATVVCLFAALSVARPVIVSAAPLRQADPVAPVDPADVQAYPPDPTGNIKWSGSGSGVAVIEAQFNMARSVENAQLGTFVNSLKLPSQAEWDAKDDGHKALWLINQERTARNLPPLADVEKNVTEVAQAFAKWLLDNNAWGHEADGRDPWERLDAKPAIGACHDFLGVAENLYVTMSTSATANPIALERAIYDWMYDDKDQSIPWGHRHALLWTPYTDDSGKEEQEGFIGLGHARGAYTFPGDPQQFRWPNTDMIVLNLFDPCATWTYAAPPPVTPPPPPPTPVPPPPPPANTAAVSGQTRLPAWVVIENQPFEPNTWPGAWDVSDSNGATNGEYMWTIDNCQLDADSGVSNGMAVGGGANGENIASCAEDYPNNVRSWMIYGPFSLADAVAAEMRLKAWVYTEVDNDMLCLLASTDKQNFNGLCVSGYSNGWTEELFDLNRVYRTGSLLGRKNIYVALAFITDDSVTRDHLGAFADNLILRKGVLAAGAAGAEAGEPTIEGAAAAPLEGVIVTDEQGHWAMTDSAGAFKLAGLSKAKHTLRPTKDGFQFYPPTISVDLSAGDVGNISFVGSTSVHEQLFIPALRSQRRTAASEADALPADYTVEDASFRLDCDAEGCSLVGPLEEGGINE